MAPFSKAIRSATTTSSNKDLGIFTGTSTGAVLEKYLNEKLGTTEWELYSDTPGSPGFYSGEGDWQPSRWYVRVPSLGDHKPLEVAGIHDSTPALVQHEGQSFTSALGEGARNIAGLVGLATGNPALAAGLAGGGNALQISETGANRQNLTQAGLETLGAYGAGSLTAGGAGTPAAQAGLADFYAMGPGQGMTPLASTVASGSTTPTSTPTTTPNAAPAADPSLANMPDPTGSVPTGLENIPDPTGAIPGSGAPAIPDLGTIPDPTGSIPTGIDMPDPTGAIPTGAAGILDYVKKNWDTLSESVKKVFEGVTSPEGVANALTTLAEGYFDYRGLDAIRDAVSQGREDVESWTNRGLEYLAPYLQSDPSKDPYMQAAIADITKQVQSSAAAQGILRSGATLQNISDTTMARAYLPYRGQNIGAAQTAGALSTGAGGNLASLAGAAGQATANWWSGVGKNIGSTINAAGQPSQADQLNAAINFLKNLK